MKILRLLLLVLSCAFSLVGWAQTLVQGGVVYRAINSAYVEVADVYEEAGPDVVFPDVVTIDSREYKVRKMDLLYYWRYNRMRSITLGKYMYFAGPDIRGNSVDLMMHLGSLPYLEEINVCPGHEWYESHDGCLYEYYTTENEKSLSLFFVPKKNEHNPLRVYPGTRKIGYWSVYHADYIKDIEVPASVEELSHSCVYGSLRRITFEDKLIMTERLSGSRPYDVIDVRELSFDRAESEVYQTYRNVVKISPLRGATELKQYAFDDCRLMFVDLPDIKYITEYSPLGQPQAIMLGDKNKVYDPTLDYTWLKLYGSWIDRNKPATICINSWIPPTVIFGGDKKTNNWTIYVPEESVETYKAHEYWGSVGEILPITDKLIPLISEPELEIEQYLTHEYLWDVMPLGEAVAADRGEWTSEDPSVATIDENGVLTAIGQGETTITFTLADTKGNLYTAESKVTVVENVSGVDEIDDEYVAAAPEMSVPDGVYDLHGRRVGDTPEGLAPGLYIVRRQDKTEKRLVR